MTPKNALAILLEAAHASVGDTAWSDALHEGYEEAAATIELVLL